MDLLEIIQAVAIAIEGIAAVLSIWCFKRYRKDYLIGLPIFLSYTFLNEIRGAYFHIEGSNNNLQYTIAAILSFSYFMYIYYSFINTPKYKRFIKIASILYICTIPINLFYANILVHPLLLSYFTGGVIIILCATLFLVELIKKSTITNIKHELFFWISAGLLLFYIGYLPIKFSRYYMSDINFLTIVLTIQYFLIIILNIFYCSGFLYSNRKY